MPNQNEIENSGLIFAACLLVSVLLASSLGILAYWPDRLPENRQCELYHNHMFDVRLLCPVDTNQEKRDCPCPLNQSNTIALSNLLLWLVCLGGLLGGVMHSAASFIVFVGSNRFRKSWNAWYFVNPFIAPGLALVLYFSLRGGLLTASDQDETKHINLYGIMTLSVLTGLFTHQAMQKLKDIFDAAFKPKDLPNSLDTVTPLVTSVDPIMIDPNTVNQIFIRGTNLDKPISYKINDQLIDGSSITAAATVTQISFKPTTAAVTGYTLYILDQHGQAVKSFALTK